jgi:ABC-type transport system involved in multi-copper enzyme maturation permease subunit
VDSSARTRPPLVSRLLPFSAVLVEDARQTLRHWALVAWLTIGGMVTATWLAVPGSMSLPLRSVDSVAARSVPAKLASSSADSSAKTAPPAPTASALATHVLSLQLVLLAGFTIALGATAISQEADIAADAILCRGVARWQYYLGKAISRTAIAGAVFFLMAVVPIAIAALRFNNDLSFAGVIDAVVAGAVVHMGLCAIGVATGAWFRSPLVAVAVAWMALFGSGIVASALEIPAVSPALFLERLSIIVQAPDAAGGGVVLPKAVTLVAMATTAASLLGFLRKDA